MAVVLSVPVLCFALYAFLALRAASLAWLWATLLAWSFADRGAMRRGRPWPWLRRCFVWKYFTRFFPMTVEVEQPLEKGRPHVIGLHPHGILCLSAWGALAAQLPGAREQIGDTSIATVKHNFWLPVWRDFLLAMGFVDAARATFDEQLGAGRNIAVVVGGAAEALCTQDHAETTDLVLRRRRGFVAAALAHGAALVPAFSFGESDVYHVKAFKQGSVCRRLQDRFKRAAGFSTPLFWGRGIFNKVFGILPHRGETVIVFGKPIALPHLPERAQRTHEVVARWHDAYVAALLALHERHRARFGAPPLRIVE